MNRDNEILHEGKVKSIENDSLTVLLAPGISCSGCHAEGSCNLAGYDDKEIKINGSFNLKPGEKVIVAMKSSQGISALFLGYLLPLIIVLTTLIIFISLSFSELISGLVSVAVLLPYYLILLILRKPLEKRYSFTLKLNG